MKFQETKGSLNLRREEISYSKMFFEEYMRNYLKELGINIDSDDYIENPQFKRLEKEFVSENRISVTSAWWIEKHIVGQKRLEKIYTPYAFGIERKLSEEELQKENWFEALNRMSKGKTRTDKDLERYFYRDEGDDNDSKKGLIKRLEKVGIYMKDFPDDQNKIKLLSLLYLLENDYKVQIVPFLNNPTIENVDDSFVGMETKNGELMSFLKRSIAKELKSEYVADVRDILIVIGTQWEYQLEQIFVQLDFSVEGEYLDNLRQISERMNKLVKMIVDMPRAEYTEPLLETFYLKLSQHEEIGLENDIIDVNASIEIDGEVTYRPDDFRMLAYRSINKSDMTLFLKENKEELIKLVFERDDIERYDRKRYDDAVDKLPFFLEMMDLNTKGVEQVKFPKLYPIVFMQEILALDKNYRINNSYYRHTTNELKTLNTELNNGIYARRKSQIALLKRVNKRMYKYSGKKEEAKYAFDAELCLDKIINRIYSANCISDMLKIHSFFKNYTDSIYLLDKQLISVKNRLLKVIGHKKKGYDLVGEEGTMRFFLGTIYNSPIVDNLGKRFGKWVLEAEVEKRSVGYEFPIELTHNCVGASDCFHMGIRIDIDNKIIDVIFFLVETDIEERHVFERNGIAFYTFAKK